ARRASAPERTDLYQDITDRIIAQLEQGRVPWVQPWDSAAAALDLPVLGVLDDDPSVGRDLARGIPPGRSRGPLADLARAVVEALGGDRREAAS
ncbi:MAG TPA: ArdC-like ssDNA-binding domain-containing protein, partial [Dermatophilaceae bacterium]|nr:ArdC-like ssDNA-binding domain-containing protein [Dermatophilaceae bacterium]